MKINMEIPDWCNEFSMYIMHGIELVAYKHPWEKAWKVKTGRCHQCGGCCTGFGEVSPGWPEVKDGTCIMLIPDGSKRVCFLGSGRPFSCSVVRQPKNVEGCTERFEEVK